MRSVVDVARIGVLLGMAGTVACVSTGALRAAEHGDRLALRDSMARREFVRSPLSNGEALALAKAVARHDLEAAGPDDAVERVHDVAVCAPELDDALADRMRTHDAAGAGAALARIEGRRLGVDDARRFADDPQAAWRAVGVRGLTRPQDRDARLRALIDPDPMVRRQAARASRDAGDPADEPLLLDAARVDPEPIVRTEAVRAIAGPRSGPRAAIVDALRDLWTGADEPLREEIARGWCGDPLWVAGGREAVRVVIASGHEGGAIEAAATALRRPDHDVEIRGLASAELAGAIVEGTAATRMQAIVEAPLDVAALRSALEVAAEPGEADVASRIAALGRLVSARDEAARRALEDLARPGGPALAVRARFALALAGDRRVQMWIEEDLAAASPDARLDAAVALGELGVPSRAAPLLADADPRVRARAACAVIVAARTAR